MNSDRLARYNAEVSRGLVHTPEWVALMADEQERWARSQEDRMRGRGFVQHPEIPDLWTFIPPARRRWFGR